MSSALATTSRDAGRTDWLPVRLARMASDVQQAHRRQLRGSSTAPPEALSSGGSPYLSHNITRTSYVTCANQTPHNPVVHARSGCV